MEYGPKGLLGVLTPQANTTVEPELWALLPPGWSLVNARLTSGGGTIEERLVDYVGRFEKTAAQFANAPVDVLAAACTGASYLIGAEAEAKLCDGLEDRFGRPFLTAARAAEAALRAMGAGRVALLSPYSGALAAACGPYWRGLGFDVVATEGPAQVSAAFHPIYAMAGSGVLATWRTLSQKEVDAILMLGTGMATLAPLLTGRSEDLIPAISCNVALVWAATQKRSWRDLDFDGIAPWSDGDCWTGRFNALFPSEG